MLIGDTPGYLFRRMIFTKGGSPIFKRALVLSAGGNKGAFEAGIVYDLIVNKGLEFDLFSGSSVGALNAAFLAQGANWEEQAANAEILKTKWLTISGDKDIYHFKPGNILELLFGGGLYQPVGLKKLIESLVCPLRLEKGKPLLIPTVALEDGELYIADSRKQKDRDNITGFLLASASMPIYFPPVKLRDKHWVDGGLRDITPINLVINEFPTEVVVVTTYPITKKLEPVYPKFSKPNNIVAVIHRIIDILTSEIASNDLWATQRMINTYRGIGKPGSLCIISPKEPFTESSLDFSPKLLKQYFNLGVYTAQNL